MAEAADGLPRRTARICAAGAIHGHNAGGGRRGGCGGLWMCDGTVARQVGKVP